MAAIQRTVLRVVRQVYLARTHIMQQRVRYDLIKIESPTLLTRRSCHCYTVAPVPLHYRDVPFPSLSYCSTPRGKHMRELMNGPLIAPTIHRPSAHFRDAPLAPLLHPTRPRQVRMHTARY